MPRRMRAAVVCLFLRSGIPSTSESCVSVWLAQLLTQRLVSQEECQYLVLSRDQLSKYPEEIQRHDRLRLLYKVIGNSLRESKLTKLTKLEGLD